MCYGSTVLWKYGHLFVEIWKKFDELEDFFVSFGGFAHMWLLVGRLNKGPKMSRDSYSIASTFEEICE